MDFQFNNIQPGYLAESVGSQVQVQYSHNLLLVLDHENISTAIPTLQLIQEVQISVNFVCFVLLLLNVSVNSYMIMPPIL